MCSEGNVMSQDFEKRSKEVLEESVARLDGRTRSRLTQARHAALAQLDQPARQWWRSYVPAGAAAAAAVLAVMLYVQPGAVIEPRLAAAPSSDDMDILADAEAPDFTEDTDEVEFYEWAAGEMDS
jgi:negative regulator of sigma E activity